MIEIIGFLVLIGIVGIIVANIWDAIRGYVFGAFIIAIGVFLLYCLISFLINGFT